MIPKPELRHSQAKNVEMSFQQSLYCIIKAIAVYYKIFPLNKLENYSVLKRDEFFSHEKTLEKL